MTAKFNNVPWDAPLFRKAPLVDLQAVVDLLSVASYHYADDTGKEFGMAQQAEAEAAAVCNRLGLDCSAVECLAKQAPQLVTTFDLLDAMFRELRK